MTTLVLGQLQFTSAKKCHGDGKEIELYVSMMHFKLICLNQPALAGKWRGKFTLLLVTRVLWGYARRFKGIFYSNLYGSEGLHFTLILRIKCIDIACLYISSNIAYLKKFSLHLILITDAKLYYYYYYICISLLKQKERSMIWKISSI